MAKKRASRESTFDADAWRAFHGEKTGRYGLDKHPEAAALVTEMLAAIDGESVLWSRVARYVHGRYPDAPRDGKSYARWAEARLGETR